jgi:hypothetical protein
MQWSQSRGYAPGLFCVACFGLCLGLTAPNGRAAPTTVDGKPFKLVATESGNTQLFGLSADLQGRIYIGNNSNSDAGIPLQRFDPALFSGSPLALQNFGPVLKDADGLTFGNGSIFATDAASGVRKIAVPSASDTLFISGAGINATGSPLVYRPSDNHLFIGRGGLTNNNFIDEYNATGGLVKSHATGTDVETMTFDPASGLIYYAPFGSNVRALNPLTDADKLVGTSSGTIDGGLTFDGRTGQLFIGTANGTNSGIVETMNITSGMTTPFASGFQGSVGLLREPLSGDLYFLESGQLYQLGSASVPEPAAFAPFIFILTGALLFRPRGLRRNC